MPGNNTGTLMFVGLEGGSVTGQSGPGVSLP